MKRVQIYKGLWITAKSVKLNATIYGEVNSVQYGNAVVKPFGYPNINESFYLAELRPFWIQKYDKFAHPEIVQNYVASTISVQNNQYVLNLNGTITRNIKTVSFSELYNDWELTGNMLEEVPDA